MDKRFLQPQLLWGYFQRWATSTIPELDRGRLQLYIFRSDRSGAYRLHGPKLYWDDNIGDSHFNNCEQDELVENLDVLAEVQGFVYRINDRNPVQWNNLEEFLQQVST